YVVRLTPQGLQGVPQNLAPYRFDFVVQSPQFEVNVDGLFSGPGDSLTVIGKLTSADVEDNNKIEQIVRVDYLGKEVPVQWMHQGNGLIHQFRAEGLARQVQTQPVLVRWDGAPIAANMKSSRSLDVPARGVFTVTQASADEDQGRRQIVV